MKVYVSYKSYLWNFKGYEPPIATNLCGRIIETQFNKITKESIKEIEKAITEEERNKYKKTTSVGSTEVIILWITKLDKEEE